MAASAHSPAFRKGLLSIVQGDKMIAPVRSYLMSPTFPSFTVKVEGLGERAPDFYFHPSAHPGWNERALYLWMTYPDSLIPELRDPTAVLSMTAGSVWHSIIGYVVTELGLVTNLEHPLLDEARRTRGKADGLMADGDLWEFKTAKESRLRMVTDVATYLTMYPTYHLQANEYMRMSGIRAERVLMMSLTFPYEMREFVIEYDHKLGQATEAKYERVLQAVADQRMPMCGGCIKTDCPARGVCQAELQGT